MSSKPKSEIFSASSFIRTEKLERAYRKGTLDIYALRRVTLTIAEGEFIVIMGASGSGKSTLLHILGCLDRPSAGIYRLDGLDITQLNDPQLARIRNQKIGFIFQSFNLLPQHTVLQNIETPLRYAFDISPQIMQARARAVAGQVGLGQRLHHRPLELSGGEMQRVAIARALVTAPRVILADEPTGNLDSRTGQEIMQMLRALHGQGHTIIVVTHEHAIAAYAERIIFLKDGAIEREVARSHALRGNAASGRSASLAAERQIQRSDAERRNEHSPPSRAPSPTPPHPSPNLGEGTREGLGKGELVARLRTAAITAWRGVLLHKLRSLLSVLGIVFGIGAIIAMLAIGAGAKQEIVEQIALLGTNTIIVKAVAPADDLVTTGQAQRSQGLTPGDVARLAQISPQITALAAVRAFAAQVQSQQQVVQARIVGTVAAYQAAGNLSLRQGRFLTPADEQDRLRVCILGAGIRQALFAFQNSLGQMVKIRNDWFRVVGTLENNASNAKQRAAIQMADMNDAVYLPLATSALLVALKESATIQEIAIRVDAPEHVDAAAKLIRAVLSRVHRGVPDYEVVVPWELLKQSQHAQSVFNLVMACIAGISLLVGGIGIMNIMLATVTERTKEIGIRRAIGASRRMILLQFLFETLLLTFVGGCLGILLGGGGAALISMLAQWRTIMSWQTILLACGISALIGIVFGLYPASQAARQNPIAALRHE